MKLYNYYFLILFLSFNFCKAQSVKTIDSIEIEYQTCLDNNSYMLGCSKKYYKKADSLLNIVYNKIRLKLDVSQKNKFKEEQFIWLKKRDTYFKKVRKNTQNEFKEVIGDDLEMIVSDKKAEFVFDRVKELIKRL